MMWSAGAEGQEPSSTRVAPAWAKSASAKMRSGERSTLMVKPFEMRVRVVVGVTGGRVNGSCVGLSRMGMFLWGLTGAAVFEGFGF